MRCGSCSHKTNRAETNKQSMDRSFPFEQGAQVADRDNALLAPYALSAAQSRGRRYPEHDSPEWGPWEIDRQRVIRSAAFRRLSHKMQVFTGMMGDYHRTRLTHTLEVALVARSIGRSLRLNEDLIEVLALAHDLGHPPFGHAGEAVLNECLRSEGGFCHNRHALRIVEDLEHCSPQFPGLNLTLETLEGQRSRAQKSDLVLLEVQAVDAADSMAYNTHDVDDALKLGLLDPSDLDQLALWRDARKRVERHCAGLDAAELRGAVLQELIDLQLADLVEHTQRLLEEHDVRASDDTSSLGRLVRAGQDIGEQKRELQRFLYERVYRHPRLLAMRQTVEAILAELFEHFARRPDELPPHFQARAETAGVLQTVGDYLAGMTDRFAESEHLRVVARG